MKEGKNRHVMNTDVKKLRRCFSFVISILLIFAFVLPCLAITTFADPEETEETVGTSYYKLRFSFGTNYYVSDAVKGISVRDVIDRMGISGEIEDVECNPVDTQKYYYVYQDDSGEWFLDTSAPAKNGGTYDSATGYSYYNNTFVMYVKMTGGRRYPVSFRYIARPVSENDPGSVEGVTVGDTINTFASAMPLSTVYIDNRHYEVPTSCEILTDEPGFVVFDGSFQAGFVGFDPSVEDAKKLYSLQDNYFEGDLFSFTFANAAVLSDGTVANVRITYSNAHIIVDDRSGTTTPFAYAIAIAKGKRLNVKTSDTRSGDSDGYYYSYSAAVRIDATIQIVDNLGNPIEGSFISAVEGINVARMGTMVNKPLYDGYLYEYYSEAIQVNGGTLCDIYVRPNNDETENGSSSAYYRKYYYPYVERNDSGIKFTGVMWAAPGNGNRPTQGANGNYAAGFVTTADALNGINFTSYGAGNNTMGYETYYMDGYSIWHRIRSSSTFGGTIQTTTEGNAGEDLADGGTVLDSGTYVVPDGKTVAYTMKPALGYELDSVTVADGTLNYLDGGTDVTAAVKAGASYNEDGTVVYSYAFPANMDDKAIHVKWRRAQSESLTVKKQSLDEDGTFTFRIRAGGERVKKECWKKMAVWHTSWAPQNSFAYIMSYGYPIVLDGVTYNNDYQKINYTDNSDRILLYGSCDVNHTPQEVALEDVDENTMTLYAAEDTSGNNYTVTVNGVTYDLYSDTKDWDVSSASGNNQAGFWVYDPSDAIDNFGDAFILTETSVSESIDFSVYGAVLVDGETDLYEFTITTEDGEGSVTFDDLPYGYAYEVTEELPWEWVQDSSHNTSGHIYSSLTALIVNKKREIIIPETGVFTDTLPFAVALALVAVCSTAFALRLRKKRD